MHIFVRYLYLLFSVAKLCLTLCNPMDYTTPGFPLLCRVCSDACPLSLWCYLSISSSAAPLSFGLQSFPASESFPMSQLFTSGVLKKYKTQRNYFRTRELAMGSQKEWDLWIQANLSSNSCSTLATRLQKKSLKCWVSVSSSMKWINNSYCGRQSNGSQIVYFLNL